MFYKKNNVLHNDYIITAFGKYAQSNFVFLWHESLASVLWKMLINKVKHLWCNLHFLEPWFDIKLMNNELLFCNMCQTVAQIFTGMQYSNATFILTAVNYFIK